jgi:hypothetical protein
VKPARGSITIYQLLSLPEFYSSDKALHSLKSMKQHSKG